MNGWLMPQTPKLPHSLPGRIFKGKIGGRTARCVIGWWWGNRVKFQQSQPSAFWFQPVYGLHWIISTQSIIFQASNCPFKENIFCWLLENTLLRDYNVHCCCCCCWVTSVVSYFVWPHGRQPTRLPRPWDSQARTLEWAGISFSNAWTLSFKC